MRPTPCRWALVRSTSGRRTWPPMSPTSCRSRTTVPDHRFEVASARQRRLPLEQHEGRVVGQMTELVLEHRSHESAHDLLGLELVGRVLPEQIGEAFDSELLAAAWMRLDYAVG